MTNLFSDKVSDTKVENFETLLKTPSIHIEKIVSNGQVSSQWYESDRDEWVVLIEGEAQLLYENTTEIKLIKGEHLFIPRKQKHKVTYTSSPAIWLAIHFSKETFI
jgi:cupin 2 domain-containing protein